MERRESHIPTLEPETLSGRLRALLNLDSALSPSLLRRTEKLAGQYRHYARSVTPLWAPGGVITTEIRQQAETWLPVEELKSVLLAILRRLCRFDPKPLPLVSPPPLSWPDLLSRLPFYLQHPDPSRILSQLLTGTEQQLPLLFALFIPPRFGGGLGRYPVQLEMVGGWLSGTANEGRPLRILDAACGSGEGTWELALTAHNAGIPPDRLTIHGSSIGELEITAAAHLFFPHDLRHQQQLRQTFAPLFAEGYAKSLRFFHDDLLTPLATGEPYDLILCNGTVGGPFIHSRQELQTALEGLTRKLTPGGTLCMADRFHGGWEKQVPREEMVSMLKNLGLSVHRGNEGMVAVKRRPGASATPEG